MLPRGLRNNNPGNIDFNPRNKWKGQIGIETDTPNPRFAKFSSMEYGVRAIVKLLQTYAKKYNADTLPEILSRYAPSHENKTDKYIENVAKWSGISPDTKINPHETSILRKLIPAIIRQENGIGISQEIVEKGIVLA